MLARKRMPKFVRAAGVLWAVALAVSLMTSVASASTTKNYFDKNWQTTVTSSWTTPGASKSTDSSCYIFNNTASSTNFKRVYVYGGTGSGWNNCTVDGPRVCYRGNGVTLPNLVNERGYNMAALTIGYDANPYVVLKGYWQADR